MSPPILLRVVSANAHRAIFCQHQKTRTKETSACKTGGRHGEDGKRSRTVHRRQYRRGPESHPQKQRHVPGHHPASPTVRREHQSPHDIRVGQPRKSRHQSPRRLDGLRQIRQAVTEPDRRILRRRPTEAANWARGSLCWTEPASAATRSC